MARRQRGRSRKTDTTDKTQKDPVVVQQKPAQEVAEAIRAIPETPAPAVEKPTPVSTSGKYGELEFFKEEFIDELASNPSDLLGYYENQKRAHQARRSTNLPGDDENATKLLKRLNELRRIIKGLGYPA